MKRPIPAKEIEADHKPKIYPRDQHPLTRKLVDPDVVRILYRLDHFGFKGYLVGGCVRDILLGKTPKDFDIATDATPRQIKKIFRNSRIIGRRFKLVHIFFPGGKNIEVATFRAAQTEIVQEEDLSHEEASLPSTSDENSQDRETESSARGRAKGTIESITDDNTFGTEETDATRRDLTINGLFYDIATFSIIDYVGGMEDLKAGVVRVIGDPVVRFAEDPVRMLRVIRHASRNNFTIDPSALSAIQNSGDLFALCSQVRVFEEFRKDIFSGCFSRIILSLLKCDLLKFFFTEIGSEGDLSKVSEEGRQTLPKHLAEVLKRIDGEVKDNCELTSEVALAAMACTIPSSSHPLTNSQRYLTFDSAEEVEAHVRAVFSKLAVPRKERERIEQLIEVWNRLLKAMELNNPEKKIAGCLRQVPLNILESFGLTIGDEHLLKFLDEERERLERGERRPTSEGRPQRRRRRPQRKRNTTQSDAL